MLPLISCIIPVFNTEQYLHRCIDSICNQTYDNLEIILVNDGSTDDSKNICDYYSNSYSNIITLHTTNNGASIARQKGLEISKGDFVCFVDSDDYIATTYISTLYELLLTYNTKISTCNVERIRINEQPTNTPKDTYKIEFDSLMHRFFKYEFWGLPGKLYKKSVFENIIFPIATLCEDYAIMIQLFHNERTIVHTEESLYFYEYHNNSLSHQQLSNRAFEEFYNVKYVYRYTSIHCPKFTDYALSNVIESAVKLYLLKSNKGNNYKEYFKDIRHYLLSKYIRIIKCNKINMKTKTIAIGIILAPQITIYIYNKYKN